jgi:4-hydroxy-3-polyprenylbenzoate decarboxylase
MPAEGVFHNLVIIKIKKAYPGQPFKVMNALWGAGQMMFSKILVIVDEDVDIHNYKAVAEAVLANTDFKQDLNFSKGPADVLDHASRKMGMGTKLGIDATRNNDHHEKFTETNVIQNIHKLLEKNRSIKNIRVIDELPLPVVLVKIAKESIPKIALLKQNIVENALVNSFQVFIFLDEEIDIKDWSMVWWIILNNIDPAFDIDVQTQYLFIDATSKHGVDFNRDWPNVVAMDESTIKKIDTIWNNLEIGKFMGSPSIKYRKLNIIPGARRYRASQT